jgi:putative membrane protein
MSRRSCYEFSESDLILRDRLALDRTVLANERTLLAYVRTALAFLITGIGLVKFFQEILLDILGVIFCVCSMITLIVGLIRYRAYNKNFKKDFRGRP